MEVSVGPQTLKISIFLLFFLHSRIVLDGKKSPPDIILLNFENFFEIKS
jgi:hypothetical protein